MLPTGCRIFRIFRSGSGCCAGHLLAHPVAGPLAVSRGVRSSWPSSPRSRSCDSTRACSRATLRLSASCCSGHADRHTNTGALARTRRCSKFTALHGGLPIPIRPIFQLLGHLVPDKANRSRRDRWNSNRGRRPYPKRPASERQTYAPAASRDSRSRSSSHPSRGPCRCCPSVFSHATPQRAVYPCRA